MGHVPHVFLPPPWPAAEVLLDRVRRRHLGEVLRLAPGAPVAYTDGRGTVGAGRFTGEGVERGGEHPVAPPRLRLTLAVAPPAARERARFLVEKLAELGVRRLVWLSTRHGEGRPPPPDKAAAWAEAALEQSRGAWLMEVAGERVGFDGLEPPVVVADRGGGPLPEDLASLTVAVGPEGGWHPLEVPAGLPRVGLGDRVLRVETSALAAAARLLAR